MRVFYSLASSILQINTTKSVDCLGHLGLGLQLHVVESRKFFVVAPLSFDDHIDCLAKVLVRVVVDYLRMHFRAFCQLFDLSALHGLDLG